MLCVASGVFCNDGTATGTVALANVEVVGNWVAYGDGLYFAGQAGTDIEIWRTDGTAPGTVLVADIRPGPFPSSPRELTVVGDYLFYFADTAAPGDELWRTDGTTAGTILAAADEAGLTGLSALGDQVIFSTNTFGRLRLAAVDSTTLRYRTLGSIGGATGVSTTTGVEIRGRLVFAARTRIDGGLWVTDGTRTSQIWRWGNTSFIPTELIATENRAIFSATGGGVCCGQELHFSDGNSMGRAGDIAAGNLSSSPDSIVSVSDAPGFGVLRSGDGARPTGRWTFVAEFHGRSLLRDWSVTPAVAPVPVEPVSSQS